MTDSTKRDIENRLEKVEGDATDEEDREPLMVIKTPVFDEDGSDF